MMNRTDTNHSGASAAAPPPISGMRGLRLYNELAEHYFDIESQGRDFAGEIHCLSGHLRGTGARDVLDLGCGSGEHVAALRRLGIQAEGMDLSDEMIRVARQRFGDEWFFTGDMREPEVERLYDGVFSLFGSFAYLLGDADVQAALRATRGILRPGGLFILEVWNAAPLRRIGRRALTPVATVDSRGKRVSRDRGFVPIQDRPFLARVNYVYYMEGRELPDCHVMRAFEPEELRKFAHGAGFRVERVASRLNGMEFSPAGNRIVLFLRAD